jgi:hypothetical protein
MRVPVGGAVMPARTVAPVVVASLALLATLEVYSAQVDEGNRQAAHWYRTDAVLLYLTPRRQTVRPLAERVAAAQRV